MTEEKNPMEANVETGMLSIPGVTDVALDMTKDEKLRTTALMLAIKYHADTIVTDVGMYQQLKMNGANLEPTAAHKVVAQAMIFEMYLRGDYSDEINEALMNELDRAAQSAELNP